jgi:hypothetical protein
VPVSYAVVEDVVTSWESYQRFAADYASATPEGLILHAAGPTDEGVRIIEVWQSEEAWQRVAEAWKESTDARFSRAPSYLREFTPAHLVVAGNTLSIHNEGGRS